MVTIRKQDGGLEDADDGDNVLDEEDEKSLGTGITHGAPIIY